MNIKGATEVARQAFAPLLQPLNLRLRQPADPAHVGALTGFSQDIRQHGVGDFPDAGSSGSFPTNSDPTLKHGWAGAYEACRSQTPAGKS